MFPFARHASERAHGHSYECSFIVRPCPTDGIMYWCDSELAPQQFIRFHLLDCHRMAPMILSRRTFLHVTAGVAPGRPRRGRLGQAYPSRPVRTCDEDQFEHATKR